MDYPSSIEEVNLALKQKKFRQVNSWLERGSVFAHSAVRHKPTYVIEDYELFCLVFRENSEYRLDCMFHPITFIQKYVNSTEQLCENFPLDIKYLIQLAEIAIIDERMRVWLFSCKLLNSSEFYDKYDKHKLSLPARLLLWELLLRTGNYYMTNDFCHPSEELEFAKIQFSIKGTFSMDITLNTKIEWVLKSKLPRYDNNCFTANEIMRMTTHDKFPSIMKMLPIRRIRDYLLYALEKNEIAVAKILHSYELQRFYNVLLLNNNSSPIKEFLKSIKSPAYLTCCLNRLEIGALEQCLDDGFKVHDSLDFWDRILNIFPTHKRLRRLRRHVRFYDFSDWSHEDFHCLTDNICVKIQTIFTCLYAPESLTFTLPRELMHEIIRHF